MANYPRIDPRLFGTIAGMPEPMERLPVELLRTADVTRDPAKMARAMAAYRLLAAAPNLSPVLPLPQKMLFQQNKSAEASGVSRGDHRPATASAQSMTAAATAGRQVVPRIAQRVPTYDEAAAARARGSTAVTQPEVTQPLDNMDVRIRPIRQPVQPPLEVFGESQQAQVDAAAAERANGTARALAEVKARYANILGVFR